MNIELDFCSHKLGLIVLTAVSLGCISVYKKKSKYDFVCVCTHILHCFYMWCNSRAISMGNIKCVTFWFENNF